MATQCEQDFNFDVKSADLPWAPEEAADRIVGPSAIDYRFRLNKPAKVQINVRVRYFSNLWLKLLNSNREFIAGDCGNSPKANRSVRKELPAGTYFARVNGANPPRTLGSFIIHGVRE